MNDNYKTMKQNFHMKYKIDHIVFYISYTYIDFFFFALQTQVKK